MGKNNQVFKINLKAAPTNNLNNAKGIEVIWK